VRLGEILGSTGGSRSSLSSKGMSESDFGSSEGACSERSSGRVSGMSVTPGINGFSHFENSVSSKIAVAPMNTTLLGMRINLKPFIPGLKPRNIISSDFSDNLFLHTVLLGVRRHTQHSQKLSMLKGLVSHL
jgi:hypothetical protein